jgi:hypothetical protein
MLDEFAEEMASLLMNNWSSHITSDMIGFVPEGRVRVITFAPHTTQIFQIFDVTLFDVLRRHSRYVFPVGDKEMTIKFLMKVYHGFKQMTVDSNIRKAFKVLVLEFDTGSESDKLSFNEEKQRQSASFRKLSSNNFALDQLSTRGYVNPFDWIKVME